MGTLHKLARVAPNAVDKIEHRILNRLEQIQPLGFFEIMECIDTSIIPPRPKGHEWSGNPLDPNVVVMAVLEKLINDKLIKEFVTSRGVVYKLFDERMIAA